MVTAESEANICRVCGVPIPSVGRYVDWSVRGCWPPFCSLACYDLFIAIAAEDTQAPPISVSNAPSERQSAQKTA